MNGSPLSLSLSVHSSFSLGCVMSEGDWSLSLFHSVTLHLSSSLSLPIPQPFILCSILHPSVSLNSPRSLALSLRLSQSLAGLSQLSSATTRCRIPAGDLWIFFRRERKKRDGRLAEIATVGEGF